MIVLEKQSEHQSLVLTSQFGTHNSNWPLQIRLSISVILVRLVYIFHLHRSFIFILSILYFLISIIMWIKDLAREFSLKGWGSQLMLTIFKTGFIIFILSEVIFFVRFFWTYFHFLFLVSSDIGGFPGTRIITPDYKFLGLVNTMLLLSRGLSLTSAHLHIIKITKKKYFIIIAVTLFLGFIFVRCQLIEYKQLLFLLSDGSYRSIFYLTTSFHGSHVFIGLTILFIIYFKNFPSFLIFELASWYWHFVDVVWLFLFSFFYWILLA